MSKHLKRLMSFCLLLILGLFVSFNIHAADVTDVDGAKYYVDKVKVENSLPYGIKQATHISYSSVAPGQGTGNAAGLGGGGLIVANQYYPQQVNILEIPSSENIKITPWATIKPFNWTLSTVKEMIWDFESKNPGYRVIAAINGDFFDISAKNPFPYTPSGVHVSGGNYYKSSASKTVGFRNDGSNDPLVGNETFTRTEKMQLDVYDENNQIVKEFEIDKINNVPANNEIAIYYATRDANHKTLPISVSDGFIVENAEYALPHSNNDFYGLGTISRKGSATLGDGQFAIVSNNQEVTNALGTGVKIRAQFEFTGDYADIEDAIGVGETILYNGVRKGSDTVRHPRTMVGVKADGTIIMTVVDGRQPNKNMYGATSYEMAAILKHYGAVEGYNLDGGGSSTMVILDNGEYKVMNSPSDGHERSDSNCLLITVKVPEIEYNVSNITTTGFTVNANVKNKNNHDFDNLYVGIGENLVKVVDGKATFTNLNVNTSYFLRFYGEKNGKYNPLAIDFRASTAKEKPTITHLSFVLDGNDLVFTLQLNDPQNSVKNRQIIIGDLVQMVTGGTATFTDFNGDLLDHLQVKLTYNLNDGQGDVDEIVTTLPMSCGVKEALFIAMNDLKFKIANIYNK